MHMKYAKKLEARLPSPTTLLNFFKILELWKGFYNERDQIYLVIKVLVPSMNEV